MRNSLFLEGDRLNEIKKYSDSRPVLVGMGTGATIGAFIGGPIGALVGGLFGGLLGLGASEKNN